MTKRFESTSQKMKPMKCSKVAVPALSILLIGHELAEAILPIISRIDANEKYIIFRSKVDQNTAGCAVLIMAHSPKSRLCYLKDK
jgi:hypothetical protein